MGRSTIKAATIRALKGDRSWAIGRFLRGYREVGYVAWDASPPVGVAHVLHRLTLIDAIEMASRFLQTDYVTEREHILCGSISRCYIFSLAQFVPEPVNGVYLYDEQHRGAWMGRLFHRDIYYNWDVPKDQMLVFNTSSRVCRFSILNAP